MIKRKICNRSGFSLAETLLAVLILLLVSMIVANGVPAVSGAYEKVVIGANAKTMLSTAITALRDELATAKDVAVDGTTITYYSADIGATSTIYLDTTNPAIMLKEYTDTNPALFNDPAIMQGSNSKKRPLVSGIGTTAGGLYVTYSGIENYSMGDESITIGGLTVMREGSESPLVTEVDLTIRLLIPASP